MARLIKFLPILALSLLMYSAVAAHAEELQPQVKSEVIMKVGNKVHLFHSGTADVKKEICIGDVITVYREHLAGGHETSEVVGKVKVVRYISEHYFEGEVVEGEVQVGDVAKKETAACLVQPEK